MEKLKMKFLDCEGRYLGASKEDEELPKSIIRSVIIETPEEEQQLRLFLTGALKVDESGCHLFGRDFGVNTGLKSNYSIEEKLRIIDTLASALKRESSVFYEHTKETEEKLLALIRSI